MKIHETVMLLKRDKFIGAGEEVEIAKGRHEMITDFSTFKNKITRLWLSRKYLN